MLSVHLEVFTKFLLDILELALGDKLHHFVEGLHLMLGRDVHKYGYVSPKIPFCMSNAILTSNLKSTTQVLDGRISNNLVVLDSQIDFLDILFHRVIDAIVSTLATT